MLHPYLVEVLPLFKNSKVIAALQEQAYRKPPRWAGLLYKMSGLRF